MTVCLLCRAFEHLKSRKRMRANSRPASPPVGSTAYPLNLVAADELRVRPESLARHGQVISPAVETVAAKVLGVLEELSS